MHTRDSSRGADFTGLGATRAKKALFSGEIEAP
jgi:hypothetical protein